MPPSPSISKQVFVQTINLFLIKTRFSSSRKMFIILGILAFMASVFTFLGPSSMLVPNAQIHATTKSPQSWTAGSSWSFWSTQSPEKPVLNSGLKSSKTVTFANETALQNRVREMMVHAWSGYKKYAWGFDELLPISKGGRNWGKYSYLFTPVDALDTLFLMDLKAEYRECKEFVLKTLDFNQEIYDESHGSNHFEITIRILGGLLGAYELDPDQRYIQKAVDLADRLMVTFEENQSGLPSMWINLATGKQDSHNAILASVGTIQLEFQYLSDITGNPKYQQKALHVLKVLRKNNAAGIPGLYPKYLSSGSGEFTSNSYGIGADADSFYEYLLKLAIATHNDGIRKMYTESVHAILKHLLNSRGSYYWFGEKIGDNGPTDTFHHLTCFTGGMLSLGAITFNWTHQLEIGRKITETCYASYLHSSTGLGGEKVRITPSGAIDYPNPQVAGRPETIESIFYQYRYSHDEKYRMYGLEIIKAIDKSLKTDVGYACLDGNSKKRDRLESFFFAETLKYLYLLYSDDSLVPLDEYVFNTEAHPLSIRGFGRRADPSKWIPIDFKL